MKWFAILFSVILTIKPSKSGHREEHGGVVVDRTIMVRTYVKGALEFPPPVIENGDCSAATFNKEYTRDGAKYGQVIGDLIYDQAVSVTEHLINAVREKTAKLKESVELITKYSRESPRLNNDLKSLTEQLWKFLELKPGPGKIEHEPLPEMPHQPVKILSQRKNRTACDVFLRLPKFFNEDFSSLYGYVGGIFLKGWHNSRRYFNLVQTAYRNEFLNGPILDAYRKSVKKVLKKCNLIQKHVESQTWKYFKAAAERVISISNEYNKSLNKVEL